MMISTKTLLLAAAAALVCAGARAQQPARQTREEYIERYRQIAIDHMERYGIPASITMAQGILESDCGNSTLSLQSNNHFGIKCKSDWKGARVYHDDDARGECFRSYPSVEESFRDHAEFLDNSPRYDSLFAYASTDYKSWARGLKAAGYATAPDYAQRLVRIIEESELYLLDRPNGSELYAAHRERREPLDARREEEHFAAGAGERIDPDNYAVTIPAFRGYNVFRINDVHYIVARSGDTFESVGRDFRISAANLRKFNDLKDKKSQPEAGQPLFIARKPKQWGGAEEFCLSRGDETLYGVSQRCGVRLKTLEKLNKPLAGKTLTAGTEVRLK